MKARLPILFAALGVGSLAACGAGDISPRMSSPGDAGSPVADAGALASTPPVAPMPSLPPGSNPANGPACNRANSVGCRCDPQTPCPVQTDDCIVLTDAMGKTETGFFCMHKCNPQIMFDPVCNYPGPGTGRCNKYEDLQTDGGVPTNGMCIIACAETNPMCPVGMISLESTTPDNQKDCICVPPFNNQ